MRIAIDGRTIVSGKTGVGVYAERVVRSLLEIDRSNQYFLFLVEPQTDLQAPNLTSILIEGYNKMVLNRIWENFLMPRFSVRNEIDLFFSPAYALPLLPLAYRKPKGRAKMRYVVTVHDLVGLLFPETFTPKMYMWQKIFVANAAKRADKIITGSYATKDDFLKLHPIDEWKITVIHHSADEDFRPIADDELLGRVRLAYGLPEKIILFVGTVEPRKNITNLAKAFAALPAPIRNDYTLVIAGKAGWFVGSIKAQIAELQLADRIKFLGYVDRRDLPALYNLATVFAYPSIHEGFGFPPLEAMSCGVPVLCSNTSSFPEVVGDAAVMLSPHEVEGMARELERLLSNDALRSDLKARGIARSRQFSARKTAEETLKVFEEAMR
ncbi:MAG: glycosyltransferase family 1 protein [Bacteroidota bacterium]